jgi:hypothetical protein
MTVTAKDVQSWLNSILGQYIDWDGMFGVQCYDLFNAYGMHFWNINFRGFIGPGDYFHHATLPNGWTRIGGCPMSQVKTGDLIMWGAANSNPIGHVAIIYDKTYLFQENWGGNHEPVTKNTIAEDMKWENAPYCGVIRPNIVQDDGSQSGTQPLTPQQSYVKMLKSLNWHDTSIFATMGSIQGESDFVPMSIEGGGTMDFKKAIATGWANGWGLIQWTPPAVAKGYPEWNKMNNAETQALVIDDMYDETKHKWNSGGAGTSQSVINQYANNSGWSDVDWAKVNEYNFNFHLFAHDDSNINIQTKLAYFIVCVERPAYSAALASYQKRLDAAINYSKQDWTHLGDFNTDSGGTSSKDNTSDSQRNKVDPDQMMVLLQRGY